MAVSVELFGLPGAGKTSLVRAIENDVARGWRLTPHTSAARFIAQHPVAAARALLRLARRDPRSLGSRDAHQLALQFARQTIALDQQRIQPVVFDEGVLTSAFRTSVRRGRPLPRSLLRTFLPATDLVVVLSLSRETSKDRIGQKDPEKLGSINSILLKRPIDDPAWDGVVDAIDAIVAVLPTDRVIHLDASADIDALAEKVLSVAHQK